jgi:transcriptional regulator with XRE-family HTH domain
MTRGQGAPPEAVLLARARKAAGMSQIAAAAGAGVSRALLQAIEYGTRRGSDKTIAAIAGHLGVTPHRLAAEGRRPGAAEVLAEKHTASAGLAERIAALPPEWQDTIREFLAKAEAVAAERSNGHRAC